MNFSVREICFSDAGIKLNSSWDHIYSPYKRYCGVLGKDVSPWAKEKAGFPQPFHFGENPLGGADTSLRRLFTCVDFSQSFGPCHLCLNFIKYGTQGNVVSTGCTTCIKLTCGAIIDFDLTKWMISNYLKWKLDLVTKFASFLLWNGTTVCSLHFVLDGCVINPCWFSCMFRSTYQ